MPEPGNYAELQRIYEISEDGQPSPYVFDLYPYSLKYWQYLGTGDKCRRRDSGHYIDYAPDLMPDAPIYYTVVARPPKPWISPTRTALYRLSDEGGQLLYIGITSNPLQRWLAHAADKGWWGDVASFSLKWWPTREVALKEETRAIRAEHPKHNVRHNQRRIAA